jgi:tRNA dimethylallyltransferase
MKPNFTFSFAGLEWKREELYERINSRVDRMLEAGLLDEVRNLRRWGYSSKLNSLQTVGYKEAFAHLAGELTYERMVELVKQNSRRYAKRQMTWFRPDERIRWFKIHHEKDFPKIAKDIVHGYLGKG